jgi:hypothetical protein
VSLKNRETGPVWPALKAANATTHKSKKEGSASFLSGSVSLLVDQDMQLAFLFLKNLLDRLDAIAAGHIHL